MPQNVLVTGASGGFGALITKSLLRDGHNVVGSMRGADGRNKAIADELARRRRQDRRDRRHRRRQRRERRSRRARSGRRPDRRRQQRRHRHARPAGDVHTPEDWKRVFDINVFGVQRVNRAVLPQMRASGSGLLIHVSSLLGRFVLPVPRSLQRHQARLGSARRELPRRACRTRHRLGDRRAGRVRNRLQERRHRAFRCGPRRRLRRLRRRPAAVHGRLRREPGRRGRAPIRRTSRRRSPTSSTRPPENARSAPWSMSSA